MYTAISLIRFGAFTVPDSGKILHKKPPDYTDGSWIYK